MRTINELACAGALLLLAFALCVARLHDMIGDELFVVASSIAGGIVFCVAHTRRLRVLTAALSRISSSHPPLSLPWVGRCSQAPTSPP